MRKSVFLCVLAALLAFPYFSHASVVSSQRNVRVNSGLMLLWSLDGQDTNWGTQTTSDKSGNGRDGTITLMSTSTTPTRGVIGQAFNFVQSGSTASVSSASFAPPSTGFSVSFWMKTTQFSGQVIWGWGNRFARVGAVTVDKLSIPVDGTSAGSATTNCIVDDGKWHHIVFTTTASAQNIYCDTVAGTSASETLDTASSQFILGKAAIADTLKYTGLYDDVRIYNRILSTDEIQTLYAMGNSKANVSHNTQANLSNGLIGYWTFDGKDMVNGAAKDLSGNNHTGNLIGISTTTFYMSGKIGQGFNFDGSDDRVNTGSDFVGTNAMTISLWMNPRTLGKSSSGRLVTNTNTTGFILRLTPTAGNSILFSSNGNTNNAQSAGAAFVFNKWAHVVVTRTSSGTANIYINGVLSGTADQDSGTPQVASTNIIIGNHNAGVNAFDGLIDDVRIYNRVISTSEITQLYNIGNPGIKSQTTRTDRLTNGLVGYWTFDGKDMPSGRANDLSGSGYTLYTKNTATTSLYTSGKIGQGLSFGDKSTTSCLDSGSSSTANLTGAVTVTAWIKMRSSALNRGIVGKATVGGAASADQYRLYDAGSNRVAFAVQNAALGASLLSLTTSNAITNGQWYFVAASYNGSDTTKLYVNAVLADSDTTASYGVLNQSGKNFEIGNSHGSSTCNGSSFDGIIDDVRVYSRELSLSEVQTLYTLGR